MGSLALGVSARVELIYGLTKTNTLLSFDSNTPGTVPAPVATTGTTGGEAIIDIHPATVAGLSIPAFGQGIFDPVTNTRFRHFGGHGFCLR